MNVVPRSRWTSRALAALTTSTTATSAVAVTGEPAHAASARVTATGRFVYRDGKGALPPVREARVEMCDQEHVPFTSIRAGCTRGDAQGRGACASRPCARPPGS